MISINDQRVLAYNSGTDAWTDYTKDLGNIHAGSAAITLSATQYLYFGSFLPFNHKYLNISSGNAVPAGLVIEIWDGATWNSAAEVFDFTESAGTTLDSSGVVQFTIDREDSWSMVGDTSQETNSPEFSSMPEIYDKYWCRVSADTSISATIDYIGQLFCSEDEFLAEYPALRASQILTSWEVGKTNWLEQRIAASEFIVSDLKRRDIIVERSQIVELATLTAPCLHKTAQMIYSGLGPRNYAEEIKLAEEYYTDSMNQNKFEQDVSGDGQKDRYEQNVSTHRASR